MVEGSDQLHLFSELCCIVFNGDNTSPTAIAVTEMVFFSTLISTSHFATGDGVVTRATICGDL